jgi:hypothetical protein
MERESARVAAGDGEDRRQRSIGDGPGCSARLPDGGGAFACRMVRNPEFLLWLKRHGKIRLQFHYQDDRRTSSVSQNLNSPPVSLLGLSHEPNHGLHLIAQHWLAPSIKLGYLRDSHR